MWRAMGGHSGVTSPLKGAAWPEHGAFDCLRGAQALSGRPNAAYGQLTQSRHESVSATQKRVTVPRSTSDWQAVKSPP